MPLLPAGLSADRQQEETERRLGLDRRTARALCRSESRPRSVREGRAPWAETIGKVGRLVPGLLATAKRLAALVERGNSTSLGYL